MCIEIKSWSLKIARLQSESHTIKRGARQTSLKAESFCEHNLVSENETWGSN